ncbi:hypothetical protein [Paracoccus aerodenitrificans]|uniref:hypothetical protein n=1 Tax=Paracoccus aerodenitrificans TaxID=3017781 RepID=UPI0022F13BD9|nr:hypothetical protein [Paracoccus aerodenitrificans]WBU64803.1 hypothetical protein PAE61_05015 [Paracoccus aerodenitrificans]
METPNIGTLDALADYTELPFMLGAAKVPALLGDLQSLRMTGHRCDHLAFPKREGPQLFESFMKTFAQPG